MKKCPTRIILWCVWHWFFKKNFLETICVGSEYIWWHDVCIKFQLEKSSKFSKRKKIRATDAARWEYLTTEFYISSVSPCLHCTLLVLMISVRFRVNSLLGVLLTKTFDILPEIIIDLGLTFPHFEFSSLYLDIFDHVLCKKLQLNVFLKNS